MQYRLASVANDDLELLSLLILPPLPCLVCTDAQGRPQSFIHARQVLCQMSHSMMRDSCQPGLGDKDTAVVLKLRATALLINLLAPKIFTIHDSNKITVMK